MTLALSSVKKKNPHVDFSWFITRSAREQRNETSKHHFPTEQKGSLCLHAVIVSSGSSASEKPSSSISSGDIYGNKRASILLNMRLSFLKEAAESKSVTAAVTIRQTLWC